MSTEIEIERLHLRIAKSGICSRRAAEQLIQEGRVAVNGHLITQMGLKVGPQDVIQVDGEVIGVAKNYTVLLNKPIGVVTTLQDPQGRPTIVRFLPKYGVQLKPVGRLDMDTEGLLLVTNDGQLANRLAHPRYGIEKEYHAMIEGVLSPTEIAKLERGIYIDGRRTYPCQVAILHSDRKGAFSAVSMVLHEGRNRQVRLMCEAVGHPVTSLKRVRIGHLRMKGMRPGEAKLLGQKDIEELKTAVGIKTQKASQEDGSGFRDIA